MSIRRNPDDTRILPKNNNVDVYQYSASQLKYLPKNAISTIEKTLLYSKRPVYLDVDVDRRSNNNNNRTKRTDDNLNYRIREFYIFKKNCSHIALGIYVDLGLVNFAMKTDIKFLFSLQRNMKNLFETRAKANSIPDEPDALFQFHDWSCIAYQEINLIKTFDIYLSSILRSEIALRTGVLPSPY